MCQVEMDGIKVYKRVGMNYHVEMGHLEGEGWGGFGTRECGLTKEIIETAVRVASKSRTSYRERKEIVDAFYYGESSVKAEGTVFVEPRVDNKSTL